LKSLLSLGEPIRDKDEEEEDLSALSATEAEKIRQKKRGRVEKRKTTDGATKAVFEQGIDTLIIGTKRDPLPLLESLYPLLGLSMPFVVYCQFQEPLAQIHHQLVSADAAVHVTLTETWMREYQVLPKRTHPLMQMSGTGGYVLFGYKVRTTWGQGALTALNLSIAAIEEEEEERPVKKQKTDE
jgi:tRNA (adenine-N(1)-)-methyltransferase non-catalytic subunit